MTDLTSNKVIAPAWSLAPRAVKILAPKALKSAYQKFITLLAYKLVRKHVNLFPQLEQNQLIIVCFQSLTKSNQICYLKLLFREHLAWVRFGILYFDPEQQNRQNRFRL